jgi:hypothetical protein
MKMRKIGLGSPGSIVRHTFCTMSVPVACSCAAALGAELRLATGVGVVVGDGVGLGVAALASWVLRRMQVLVWSATTWTTPSGQSPPKPFFCMPDPCRMISSTV